MQVQLLSSNTTVTMTNDDIAFEIGLGFGVVTDYFQNPNSIIKNLFS
jgi:hypothetical protein